MIEFTAITPSKKLVDTFKMINLNYLESVKILQCCETQERLDIEFEEIRKKWPDFEETSCLEYLKQKNNLTCE